MENPNDDVIGGILASVGSTNSSGPGTIPPKKKDVIGDILATSKKKDTIGDILNQTQPPVKHEDFGDLLDHTLSNTVSTLGSSISNAVSAMGQWDTINPNTTDPNADTKKQLQGLKGVYDNFVNTSQDFYNGLDKLSSHIANTPISQLPGEALDSIKGALSGINNTVNASNPAQFVSNIPSGIIKMTVDDPIGAVTSTVNNNGVATPATPEQLTQKYQSVAGLLASGQVAKEIHGALLGPVNSADEAITALNQNPFLKAGKVIGTDVAASTGAGIVQGGISGLGSDDNLKNAIAGALTFLPVGVAFGITGIGDYNDLLKEQKSDFARVSTTISAQDLAALNSLKITSNSTLDDLSSSMESIMQTKNWVKAAILKRMKTGQGYVIEGTDGENLPEVPQGSYTYHSPSNNSTLVVPFKLGRASEAFFTKNGFMPREVVNFGGDDHFVVKEAPAEGQLIVKNINTGRESEVPIEALRRNNSSMVTSSYMASMSDVTGDTRTYNSLKELLQVKAPDSRGYQDLVNRAQALERRVGSNGQESVADIVRKNRDLKAQDIEDRKRGYKFNVPNAPDEVPQDLSKLIPQGKPGVDLIDSGQMIKVVNRDENGNGNGILTLQKDGEGKAKVFTVYVDPSVRRQGIASSLYDAAEKAGYTLQSNESGLTDQGRALVESRKPTPKVIRDNNGRFIKPVNPVEGQLDQPVKVIKAGVLNPENYLNGLAQKFTNIFNASDKPFNVTLDEFAKKYGISDQDKIPLQSAVYKRLSTDLASGLLSPQEVSSRQRLQKSLEASNQDFIQQTARRIDQNALSNGMYVDAEGSGRYRIRSLQDGSVLSTVGSPDEAIKYIKNATQSNWVDLDGGDTGGVPTALGNPGGMAQPYRTRYTPLMKSVDLLRLGPVINKLVPSGRLFPLVDNITNSSTKLFNDVFLKGQEAQIARRNFLASEPIDNLTTKLNAATNLGRGLSPERLMLVGDNVTTKSANEIISGLLSRPMFKTEIDASKKWFKGTTTKDVSDLMYSAKSISGKDIGTPEYDKVLQDIVSNSDGKYSPETLKAASNLSASAANFDPKDFSPMAVMRLAKAFEDPASALTRQEHADKYNLTAQERALSSALDDYYQTAFQHTGIDQTRQISGYLPDIVLHNAVDGRGSNINPLFARELTRVGITPKNLTEQNPLVAARMYHYGLVNHASGFSDMMGEVQKNANDNIKILSKDPDPKVANLAEPIKSLVNRHIDDIMGRKDPAEMLTEIANDISNGLLGTGIKPDVGSAMELFSLSKIGLRFGLSIRDAIAVLGRTVINLSPEFAKEALFKGLSNEALTDLHAKGIFGNQDLQNILDTKGEKLLSPETALGKVAGAAFAASGQEAVYNRSLAGLYMATQKIGGPILERLRRNEITKDEAYDKLGLGNYGPSITQTFDNFVSSGRPDKALDFLGQLHGRTISTVFGNNNTPIGWNSKFGKLMSQYGYWGTNATNTLLESATYGTKSQIAKRMLRTGLVMGAISAAGNAAGVDLHSWMFANPFEIFPQPGPLANVIGDTYRTYGRNQDALEAGLNTVGGIAADFIPFTNVVRDWSRAYDSNNPIAGILNAAPQQ